MVVETSVLGKGLVGAYGSLRARITTQTPGILEQGHAICNGELYALKEQFIVCYWVLGETKVLLMGHQKNMQLELL